MFEVYWFDYDDGEETVGIFNTEEEADSYIIAHGGYDGTYGFNGYGIREVG